MPRLFCIKMILPRAAAEHFSGFGYFDSLKDGLSHDESGYISESFSDSNVGELGEIATLPR